MSFRALSPQRWLCTLAAAFALLLGTGAHGWLHSSDLESERGCTTHGIQLHAGDCEHHGDEVDDHATDCLLCKTNSRQVALPLDEGAAGDDASGGQPTHAWPRDLVRASDIPGVLGARAPPVTTG
jgi:hypothetical protein